MNRTNVPEVDQALEYLRPMVAQMKSEGASPLEILKAAFDSSVGKALVDLRGLILLTHLFGLSLGDAKRIGWWHQFGYGSLTDEEVADVLRTNAAAFREL